MTESPGGDSGAITLPVVYKRERAHDPNLNIIFVKNDIKNSEK